VRIGDALGEDVGAWSADRGDDGLCVMVVGDGLFATHPLPERGAVTIGRAPECDVRIDHPSVSRRHATLHVGDRLRVEDLGSANGTRARGERLVPGELVDVGPGEAVEVGRAMLIVQPHGASPRPIRPAAMLAKNPASTRRVLKAEGCAPPARAA
jgi:pSer/pThr/pTyr-binding forkhead associated (FHA) protein